MLEKNEYDNDHWQGHRRVKKAVTDKKSHPVDEIVHRLDQEAVHLTITDVGRYLPLIVSRGDQTFEHQDQEEVEHDRSVIEVINRPSLSLKNRPPNENGAQKRKQAKERPEEKIPAIHESVLQTDIENLEILLQPSKS